MRNLRLTRAMVFIASFWCTLASANEPIPTKIKLDADLRAQTLLVVLENREKFAALVEVTPGEMTTIHFQSNRIKLAPAQKAELKLAVREIGKGRQVVHLQTRVVTDNQMTLVGPQLYQPIFFDGQSVKKISYDQAFLSRRERISGESKDAEIDLGGAKYVSKINPLAFKANVLPAGSKIEPMQLRAVQEYAKMPLRQLPKDIQLGEGRTLFESDFDNNMMEENPAVEPTEVPTDAFESFNPNFDYSAQAITVKGHMSLRTAPGTYKAAWGWVVRAWQNVAGIWIFLGWTYVGGDGSWQIALPTVLPGIPVRIEYQTKNRFVSIQDANGNPYTWGDNWNISGNTDIGYRYADLTVNGDLPGVDKLYVGATNVWVKFFNNGMNALRDKPIRVTFPNALSSGQCISNDGDGPYAWSCSYWNDGRIYIIPEHASPSVVQHEIAHSINSYYWNGNMPPGSGGSHNLWDCYNNGLALTEGWANFVTYWTQFDRTSASAIAPYFGMNIESIPSGVCANQTAEMRVASAFWDMYDVPNDSVSATAKDSLYYVNQAVPVAIYLNNKRNSMAEYLPVTQSGQSSFWQGEFTKLFRLNKIVP